MKTIIDDARREFIAKSINTIGTAIFTVGLASNFFKELPIATKILLAVVCFICLLGSIFIHPKRKEGP